MTLEVLFAREAQVQCFLLMACAGAVLGLLIHLAGWLHRAQRAAGLAADLLCGALAAGAGLYAALATGSGVRLYGLLGLAVGALLYLMGAAPLVRAAARLAQKMFPRPAGKQAVHAESTVHREDSEG